jgi:hypothetical protein
MPGLSEALKPQQGRQAVGQHAPPKAVAGPPPAPREEPRAQAGSPRQPASAKTAKASDEDWWTE